MAQVKMIEFGSNNVSLSAKKGNFHLVIQDTYVAFSAKTCDEMREKIEAIIDDLRAIAWELEKTYAGMFQGLDAEPAEEATEEATAG